MPVILAPDRYSARLDTKDVSAEEALDMTGPAPDDLLKAIPMPRTSTARSKAKHKGQDKDEDNKKESLQPPLL
jgi:putative SOS response-associated peptidase YedK